VSISVLYVFGGYFQKFSMQELIREIEGYLEKQKETIPVPVRRKLQAQAQAQETAEQAYTRRLQELGW